MNNHTISSQYDFAIIGMGASGFHLAMAMLEDPFFDSKKILLLDENLKNTNDRTWSFWEKGIGKWDNILSKQWAEFEIQSHDFHKIFDLGDYRYKMIKSLNFYEYCLLKLSQKSNFTIKYEGIKKIEEKVKCVYLHTVKSIFQASYVFSSLPDSTIIMGNHPSLQQHFGGWFIKVKEPVFRKAQVQFMNFNIPQNNSTQFMYVLPFNDHEALMEFTIFSKQVYKRNDYETFLKEFLNNSKIVDYTITEKEFGAIPMTTYPFWQKNTERKMLIGSAGGWTKPSTGYTFYFCQQQAERLTNFLKTNTNLSTFKIFNRFYWYDLILLKVLTKYNELGSEIFSSMFRKNKIKNILRFLSNESTIWEEISIISRTKHRSLFFKAFINSLLK
ncbi:MAG: lycopene cyclase [Saprospiraceae bacterium]|nr:lycopene cyclase [Saprospiraceae bacterium]MBK6566078.1 lycopene cyclase [Saprospiraceae bacterium]MBK8548278.1 lycopene cyclase [Saprospiraceae bacterium]MBK8819162.1 lycopene cyclase [Saprospiraceae bacterium]MBK8855817.1 lycopene cyclase [Saprospiraceae bacterium]